MSAVPGGDNPRPRVISLSTRDPHYMTRLHERIAARGRLPMWIVYHNRTREYPGLYVARMHVSLPQNKPTRFTIVRKTLPELLRALPRGLRPMQRHPLDPQEILSIWL